MRVFSYCGGQERKSYAESVRKARPTRQSTRTLRDNCPRRLKFDPADPILTQDG